MTTDEDVMWFVMLEDYFGVHVDNPERWENELRREKADVDNDYLCRLIRMRSYTIADMRRKLTLADITNWIRNDPNTETIRQEGCEHCHGGWMSFSQRDGVVIVWEMAGDNGTTCPCVCAAGQRVMNMVIDPSTTDALHLRKLQQLVIKAMKTPKEMVHKEYVPPARSKLNTEPPPLEHGIRKITELIQTDESTEPQGGKPDA